MTKTATNNLAVDSTVFVLRGLGLQALGAGQYVETDGAIRDNASGESFELGQRAFYGEKEAREVASALVSRFRL